MLLSEFESKEWLRRRGVPTVAEVLASDAAEAASRGSELGFPVALKLCSPGLAHKTERGLVRLGLQSSGAVREAAETLLAKREPGEEGARLLVQSMVAGRRELIAGLVRDRQFGPCVMLGLGGILAEAVGDVVFRVAPFDEREAKAMMDDLAAARLLGAFRGEPPVDRDRLAKILVALGELGVERPDIASIDVNPLVVRDGEPIAVDALVEIDAQ